MPKTIYTERDIEDMQRDGVREIVLADDVYLTDAARERAERLEIRLRVPGAPAVPSAPAANTSAPRPAASAPSAVPGDREELVRKVKAGVIARLGSAVDANMVETIVRRVVTRL